MPATRSARRTVLGLLPAIAIIGLAPRLPLAARSPEAVIESLVGHIIELLESDGLGGEGAMERLAATIDDDTDLDRLGRLVLGRHWRNIDEAQQAEYLKLFRQLMLTKFVGHLGAYSGKRLQDGDKLFEILGNRPIGDQDVIVESRVAPPDRPPLAVKWRLRGQNGDWVIIDLIVENVSLLISQRSEFATVIERRGVDGLLAELRDRLARTGS